MDIILPDLPDTSDVLVPPKTIFYPPVVEEPFLDPILLPSLEQVKSGLQVDQAGSSSTEKEPKEEVQGINQEQIPKNLPKNLENTSSETVATFNLPFFGEMPIPAPEVIASSVIAAGTASVVSVAGGIAGQAVLNQIKKIFKKIFTKILKKEVANVKEKMDNKKGS
ncbi:MAG: hypothetical protein CMH18_11600 [Methylophaga sp.]|uniref:hypothetical protein n=1 Tax=Methylophaga sp. TaxID=2024840 RepID=UPI000C8AB92F|nr:hypothetical protein [Methylophaga sp.]MAL50395.1 hypothetical protein [Methylophaga sp.]|tara:strand:- start:1107 stop:1604 length:498 start_codon:yes stop_codon:yes gene_type:complete